MWEMYTFIVLEEESYFKIVFNSIKKHGLETWAQKHFKSDMSVWRSREFGIQVSKIYAYSSLRSRCVVDTCRCKSRPIYI